MEIPWGGGGQMNFLRPTSELWWLTTFPSYWPTSELGWLTTSPSYWPTSELWWLTTFPSYRPKSELGWLNTIPSYWPTSELGWLTTFPSYWPTSELWWLTTFLSLLTYVWAWVVDHPGWLVEPRLWFNILPLPKYWSKQTLASWSEVSDDTFTFFLVVETPWAT